MWTSALHAAGPRQWTAHEEAQRMVTWCIADEKNRRPKSRSGSSGYPMSPPIRRPSFTGFAAHSLDRACSPRPSPPLCERPVLSCRANRRLSWLRGVGLKHRMNGILHYIGKSFE